jgi:hypothetical protein
MMECDRKFINSLDEKTFKKFLAFLRSWEFDKCGNVRERLLAEYGSMNLYKMKKEVK